MPKSKKIEVTNETTEKVEVAKSVYKVFKNRSRVDGEVYEPNKVYELTEDQAADLVKRLGTGGISAATKKQIEEYEAGK